MRYCTLLLFFMLQLWSNLIFAQKNTITFGALYLPIGEYNNIHSSVGVYRYISGSKILGIKAMYTSTDFTRRPYLARYSRANLDLVYRWTKTKAKRRSIWNFDAGLSAAMSVEELPPVEYWGFCGTGLTQRELDEMQHYYDEVLSKWQVERNFMPGLATAVNWEYRLSDHFNLGLGLVLNTYLSSENDWQILPLPSLNTAYHF